MCVFLADGAAHENHMNNLGLFGGVCATPARSHSTAELRLLNLRTALAWFCSRASTPGRRLRRSALIPCPL